MPAFVKRLLRIFQPAHPVPDPYRPIFLHFFMDMAWFGVLSGSTVAFLAVYATRMGASDTQIGFISAAPALVNLLFSLPAGSWLSKRSLGRAVFWSSVLQRMFYLVLIPLPMLFLPKTQVWVIILTTLVMTIPGTAMVVGFNSQFGEVVPLEWRGYVAGIRNALLSVMTTILTLLSGWILDHVTFPTGYQIVFGIGVLGAGMSSLHLYLLSSIIGSRIAVSNGYNGYAQPRTAAGRRLALEARALYQRGLQSLRLDAMRGPFARVMALLFGFHLMQYMPIPVFTPFVVNQLHLSDQLIGLAGGLFNLAVFIGSLNLNWATGRYGTHKVTASGMISLSLYPILTSLGPVSYLIANIWGGLAWALAGGGIYNYILENVPADDRPAHLAWYSLISNGAILIGSLSGPAIAMNIGPATALVLFGVGRFMAGAAVMKWGSPLKAS